MASIKDAHEGHARQQLAAQVRADLAAADTGTALPAATSALRGRSFFLQGGAGVADKAYVCVKTATDTYTWVQTATG